MDARQRKLLDENLIAFCEDLNLDKMLVYLTKEKFFDEHMVESIRVRLTSFAFSTVVKVRVLLKLNWKIKIEYDIYLLILRNQETCLARKFKIFISLTIGGRVMQKFHLSAGIEPRFSYDTDRDANQCTTEALY